MQPLNRSYAQKNTARRSRNQNDLECADLSALWHGGTRPAAPGDESPGGKAATSHRTPKSSWRARNRTYRNTKRSGAGGHVRRAELPFRAPSSPRIRRPRPVAISVTSVLPPASGLEHAVDKPPLSGEPLRQNVGRKVPGDGSGSERTTINQPTIPVIL